MSYKLNRNITKEEQAAAYTRKELELMSEYRLREICLREHIVKGFDKDMTSKELIEAILSYCQTFEDELEQKATKVESFVFAKVKEECLISVYRKVDSLIIPNWQFTIQNKKMYIMPKVVSKESAAKFVISKLKNRLMAQLYAVKSLYPDKKKWNEGFLGELSALIKRYQAVIHLHHIGFVDEWEEVLKK